MKCSIPTGRQIFSLGRVLNIRGEESHRFSFPPCPNLFLRDQSDRNLFHSLSLYFSGHFCFTFSLFVSRTVRFYPSIHPHTHATNLPLRSFSCFFVIKRFALIFVSSHLPMQRKEREEEKQEGKESLLSFELPGILRFVLFLTHTHTF